MPLFLLALCFIPFLLGHVQKSKFEFLDDKVFCIFRLFIVLNFLIFLFCLSSFSFSYLFVAGIVLLLGLLPVQKCLKMGNLYQVKSQKILLQLFHSNF